MPLYPASMDDYYSSQASHPDWTTSEFWASNPASLGMSATPSDDSSTNTNEDFTTSADWLTTESYGEETAQHVFLETRIAHAVDSYGSLIVILAGLIGNALTIMVFRRKRMRKMVTSMYLVALACSDMLKVSVGLGTRHFLRPYVGYDPPSLHSLYCQAWYYIGVSASIYSHWLLAGMSIERCIAILAPFKAKSICTSRNTKLFLIGLLVVSFGYTTHSFVTYHVTENAIGKRICTSRKTTWAIKYRPTLDLVIKSGIPTVIIFACNMVIVWKLIKVKAKWGDSKSAKDESQLTSLAVMLVTISVAFLVLTLPHHVLHIMGTPFPATYNVVDRKAAQFRLIWGLALFVLYVNHCINFFLYAISGGEFRRELKAIFTEWCCCKKPESTTEGSTSKGNMVSQSNSTNNV